MKKFQINKQKLNLKTLTTPLLALSLMAGCAGLFGGSVSAASNHSTASSNVPGYAAWGFTEGIVSTWPVNFSDLSSGGAFWSFGPDDNHVSPGGRRYETFKFPQISCDSSSQVTAATYRVKLRINDVPNTDGVLWIIFESDGSMVTLTRSDTSSGFVEYTANITSPTTLAAMQDYGVALMYENNGSTGIPALVVDVDEISRDVDYDDSSCPSTNTTPTITSPSAVTIPSTTTSGSTVVPGSSLAAADTDGDALTYSITAGNANSYFAIDSNTGNITTTQTNIPAGTYTITVQVDDGKGGTATADVTITVTASTTPALYCPSPYSTTTLLTPSGDCDEDGITNQTEGFDPDGDGNPSTGTAPIDTDGDSIPDYLDLDSDNDGILDTEEKGTLANSSTNPSDVDSDGTPDFRDLDSDNDSTKDVLESGRNNLDTNNDGRIDGTTNTYGIPSSAASTTNPKTLASTSLKDSDNNGTPDYRQPKNSRPTLASTGQSLKAITIVATMALGLAGYVKVKNKNSRAQSYRRR